MNQIEMNVNEQNGKAMNVASNTILAKDVREGMQVIYNSYLKTIDCVIVDNFESQLIINIRFSGDDYYTTFMEKDSFKIYDSSDSDKVMSNIIKSTDYKNPKQVQDKPILEASTKKIRNSIKEISIQFVSIGYELFLIDNHKSYKQLGYTSLADYTAKQFDFSKTVTKNLTLVYKNFAEMTKGAFGYDVPQLKEKFKEYHYSQLVEMNPMTSAQLALCRPSMTVLQLRDLKKADKEDNVIFQDDEEPTISNPVIDSKMITLVALKEFLETCYRNAFNSNPYKGINKTIYEKGCKALYEDINDLIGIIRDNR